MTTEKTKQYVGMALIFTLIVVAWSVFKYSSAYEDSVVIASNRTITVTADAKVVAVPDVATFSAGVITQGGKDLAALQKENTEKSNKIIAFIKSKGVAAKDIQTEQYSLEPRYQTSNCYNTGVAVCPPSVIVGYSITQSISVKVRNFDTIGDLLSGVVTAGANNVTSINFTIDEPDTLQNEAREKAIAKALEKAKTIARAGGFTLGNIVSFDEGYVYPPQPYYAKLEVANGVMDSMAQSAPSIEAGSQNVTANVTIRYEIK